MPIFLFFWLKIGWDESAAGDRPSRVSVWDIEPVLTPFYICPPPFFRPRFAGQPGMPGKVFVQFHFLNIIFESP